MDFHQYLTRLQIKEKPKPTLGWLSKLHLAHLHTIPFENLSIIWGEPVHLDLEKIYQKIILNHRGGFCYELNGLFAELLKAVGFRVDLLSAQVYKADKEMFGPPFDHLTLRVTIDNHDYLADVGFGDSFLTPLDLAVRTPQKQKHGDYRITGLTAQVSHPIMLVEENKNETWQPVYQFSLTPRVLSDFKKMFHFHHTSPQSSFTRKLICTMASPEGRVIIRGDRYIETLGGKRTERVLQDDTVVNMALNACFGIENIPGFETAEFSDQPSSSQVNRSRKTSSSKAKNRRNRPEHD